MVLQQMAIHEFRNLQSVLQQLTIQDYNQSVAILDHISIGKHVRHTLEFAHCLFEKIETISYDKRARKLELEQQPSVALKEITSLISIIETAKLDFELLLDVQYANETIQVKTSFYRELVFVIEHTVHHLAILRIALVHSFPQVQFPAYFGYADSTIRFHTHQKIAI